MQPHGFEQQYGQPASYRDPAEPLWMRHDRTPGQAHDDFLAPVDPAIGPVISASTNRTKSGWYPPTKQQRNNRIAIGILGVILGGLAGLACGALLKDLALRLGLWAVLQWGGALMAVLGAGGAFVGATVFVALLWLSRRPQSSFVGKHGLMRYTRGLFGPKHEVFRFEDASELKVQRIRQFVNGAYTGTNYDYTWRNPQGKLVFRIAGQYHDGVEVASHDPLHFATAAEAAWSTHRIQHFDRMIQQQGIARFPCGRDWIGVGKGVLEIGAGGQTQLVRVEDTKDIHFEQGVLVIKKKDSKEGLFKSEGVYRFPVAALSDFQVFLVVLEEQTGIRFR